MNPSEEPESRGILGSGSRVRRMRTMRGSGAQTVRDLRNNMGKFCLLNHLLNLLTLSQGPPHLARPLKNPCAAVVRQFAGVWRGRNVRGPRGAASGWTLRYKAGLALMTGQDHIPSVEIICNSGSPAHKHGHRLPVIQPQ
ncbi:hypothetical protein Bbelb_205130 [Branchiostoma belcheri]|nr:hypothetical protein Bbelb_205130 [Branchiostoma belcheri]